MDGIELLYKLKKITELRHQDVVNAILGGVDNMDKYQYMLGQIRTYQYILQEISNLLKNKEQSDNIIDIKTGPKT
jgi:hypothetical protein|tara:strand:- start:2001 stop:2225 length:225 start_codon:yes stop_codon:yes gene_type:complete